ncbi:MAG: hypothetical protein AB1798_02930, partial [Spirochaetota bacterium]
MVHIHTARSGLPYATANGLQLHSAYDPQKEALNYILHNLRDEQPSTIILLGACLDYLHNIIKNRYPFSRVILVFYDRFFYEMFNDRAKTAWHPEMGIKISRFFASAINEIDIEGLKILEWPPASKAYPHLSDLANKFLSSRIKELNGNIMTTRAFGKRWIKNSLLNLLFIEKYGIITKTNLP